LKEVLGKLQEAGLRLQKDKCVFFQNSVTYLGYVIDKRGLRTCPTKVAAILDAPAPSNVLGVKRFLGVVNYYRNFIPSASAVLSPLHELLRAGAGWRWGERQQAAFDSVKRELASERVLAHFDPAAPLMLTVDAGPVGLGAVLAHRDASGCERPIAFASRSLTTSEKNYSQIQKEATAIVFGVKYFHQYLYGRQEPFILKTDHRPLLSIFGKEKGISVTAALRLQRYAVTLSAYNYIVQYVDGKNNQIADFFSRAPLSVQYDDGEGDDCSKYFLFFESNAEPVLFNDIRRATAADSVLKTVMKYMDKGWPKKIKCKSILPYFQCKTDL
ncbi:jg6860, partial [Pararge aegeria aegeria]